MKHRHGWLLPITLLGAMSAARNVRADTVSLEGSCEYRGGVECTASCGNISFEASCDVELAAACRGRCTANAEASCSGSCQGTCEGACTANPGNFSCQGSCTGQCAADCDAQCSASTNGASSQADCNAKCKAACNGSCDANCTGDAPQVDCKTRCQASCNGQCTAKANVNCQVGCQVNGHADCVTRANADCSANCQTHGGVVVCDGAVQAFVETVEAARAWLAQHLVITASGGSSCTNNSCEAHGSASASTKCSMSSAPPVTSAGAVGAEMGVFGLALLIGKARRRRR